MNFIWDETKRQANRIKHGLDFSDAERMFAGHTLSRPDTQFAYGEARFSTMGLLGVEVSSHRTHRNRRHNQGHFDAKGRTL